MSAYLYAVIPYDGEPHPYSKEENFEYGAFIPELYGMESDLCEDVSLFHGFFLINTCFRMPSIMTDKNGFCSLRKDIYEIAKAVGAKEVWYIEELATDSMDSKGYSLNTFLTDLKELYSDYFLEYDIETMREKGGTYASYMHDDFHDIVL